MTSERKRKNVTQNATKQEIGAALKLIGLLYEQGEIPKHVYRNICNEYYDNGNILSYNRVGKELVIDPEQAKTVRKIYDWYLDGMGVRQIQFELEKEGVLTAMGKTKWYESNISNILKNPFYAGNTLILHIRSLNPYGYMS